MKKVNSIGKKIMSIFLTFSLLLGSLGATKCKAEDPKESKINHSIGNNKEILKKVWDVGKWGAVAAFAAYSGYKNSEDIINLGKECLGFILENKESFKEVLNGGVSALKGIGNTAYNTTHLVYKFVKFLLGHTEAAKNVMAAIGTYSIYNNLKSKIKNLGCFKEKRKNKKDLVKFNAVLTME